ncbi:MAG: VOC family protein [Flavobacteriales bacterium]|nr:VOC family protein [Flavobacteriales bacterium]
MLNAVNPKLPMRDKEVTRAYYVDQLGFHLVGDYDDYLMVQRDNVEIHFFLFADLDPRTNYGQVYIRSTRIDALYEGWVASGIAVHPNGPLRTKPWGQREFALLDPDNNLLTFGQAV